MMEGSPLTGSSGTNEEESAFAPSESPMPVVVVGQGQTSLAPNDFAQSLALSEVTDSIATTSHRTATVPSFHLQPAAAATATATLDVLMAAGEMPSFKGQARSVIQQPTPQQSSSSSNETSRSFNASGAALQGQLQYQSSTAVIAIRDDDNLEEGLHQRVQGDYDHFIPVVEAVALEESHPSIGSGRGSGSGGNSSDQAVYYCESGLPIQPQPGPNNRSHPRGNDNANDDSDKDHQPTDREQQRYSQLRSVNYALSILVGLVLAGAAVTGAICNSRQCQFFNNSGTAMNPSMNGGMNNGNSDTSKTDSHLSHHGSSNKNEVNDTAHHFTGVTAFTSTDELYQAVDAYMAVAVRLWQENITTATAILAENNDSLTVAYQYGYPMSMWNVSRLTNFSSVFDGKRNADLVDMFDEDLGGWDMSRATDTFRMFGGLRRYTGKGLEHWNVGRVTNMRSMFSEAYQFQGNISAWSVSRAVFLKRMFSDSLFNVDISQWDVSNVEDLGWVFYECSEFNQDLSRWNVRKVKDFDEMFGVATSFNSNISGWNVENAVTMEGMFDRAYSFNQDLSSWDVRKVTNLYNMLGEAREFNQSLCAWGQHLNPTANVSRMFRVTNCLNMSDPILSMNSFANGPICHPC